MYAGISMVSNAPFFSGKSFALGRSVPFWGILLVVAVFVFVSSDPPVVLFGLFVLYGLSGWIIWALLEPRASLAAGTARAGSHCWDGKTRRWAGFSWPRHSAPHEPVFVVHRIRPGWKCVTPESRPMYTYISEFQTLFS